VVLLTGDDVGGTQPDKLQPRARQNVILELGYFVGKLGRSQVCALRAEGVEIPSDFAGVVYHPLDAGGAWKFQLARELKAAGYAVDLNDAL
jgi:predicted nucleotide-binding protein